MPLSWNEIKSRANAFSKNWADACNEDSQAKPFLIDFFEVFGITDKRVASFEHAVKKHGGGRGYVDLFWPGILLVEMKSRGKSLDRAFGQAMDYFPGIVERDLPRYVLVCDFARFRLFDLSTGTSSEFPLATLYQNVKQFGFIAGYQTQVIKPQDPINIRAAERMGRLHDQLKDVGYTGRPLEIYLVRLLFCLFAEDTGIFQKRQFQDYVENRTTGDGSDLAHHLATLFYVLNTPYEQRLKNLDEDLVTFPYVNGRLFDEMLPPASFDSRMREALLDLCALDWSLISPAIFGSLFQSIMDDKARRNLGAHYTSEENILKLIKPLFLDALWVEFEKVKSNKNRLFEFHKKLRSLTFFDPACGCGNFLVITYRELRLLELDVLRASRGGGQQVLDVQQLINVDVDQFHGIELEEFPAQIAQVALWLTDHQMNMRVSEEFGSYYARIPLKATPHIVHGNALRLDWTEVLAPQRCSYVLGNPPFVGAMVMSDAQRDDMAHVFHHLNGYGVLDYVSAWYWKAAHYIRSHDIRCAFVSTNSITQGEQVGLLWQPLMNRFGIHIHFAHQTFQWNNEARGKAAVHCVIVGFGYQEGDNKTIFEYEDIKGPPHALKATNITPYLVDGPTVFLSNRSTPLCAVPAMRFGSMPRDSGNLILLPSERNELLAAEPWMAPYILRYTGADEFLNAGERYCLWLIDAPPDLLARSPKVLARLDAVRKFRQASKASSTQKFAATPALFCQIAQPDSDYLLVPGVSSERRRLVPIGFMHSDVVASNLVFVVPDATSFHFGVISSTMHNAWMRYTAGRLKSDYRYSKDIVYNNFPWPEPSDKQQSAIEVAAQAVLDARIAHPGASLADLYDLLTMPPDLLRAHQALDRAVDAAYGYKGDRSDAARVAFLFERYQKLTSLFPVKTGRRKK
jgi:hypothetical protein